MGEGNETDDDVQGHIRQEYIADAERNETDEDRKGHDRRVQRWRGAGRGR